MNWFSSAIRAIPGLPLPGGAGAAADRDRTREAGMAKHSKKTCQTETGQGMLFDYLTNATGDEGLPSAGNGAVERSKLATPRVDPVDVRAIQDLLWKEARWALTASESFTDDASFEAYLGEHLPQNSPTTRTRYAQTLVRWFFPDGVRGL